MNRRFIFKLAGAAGLTALIAGCTPIMTANEPDIAASAGQFTTLLADVQAAGLVG